MTLFEKISEIEKKENLRHSTISKGGLLTFISNDSIEVTYRILDSEFNVIEMSRKDYADTFDTICKSIIEMNELF